MTTTKTAKATRTRQAPKGSARAGRRPPSSASSLASASAGSYALGAEEPLYKQLVSALRHDIVKGIYPVGSKLPSEQELCSRHGLSRHTVREALRELRASGVVTSRQGAGTIVVGPDASQSYIHQVGSISDLTQYASTRFEVSSSEMLAIDESLAMTLESAPGTAWLRLEALRYSEHQDTPAYWTEVFLHPDYAGVARLIGREQRPVYEMIEALYGERVGAVEQVICAQEALPAIAKALKIAKGATVIEVTRTYRFISGKIFEVSRNLYPSHQFRLTLNLRRAPA